MRILQKLNADGIQQLFSCGVIMATTLVCIGGLHLLLLHSNAPAINYLHLQPRQSIGFGIISIGIWLLASLQIIRLILIILNLMQTKDWLLVFLACITITILAFSFSFQF